MNTNDLSPKQQAVLNIVVLQHTAADGKPKLALRVQIENIFDHTSDMTAKAIDSQLRSLASKGWLTKTASGMFDLTADALKALDAEIDASPDRHVIDRKVEQTIAAEKRITAHTNCDHDTSKAARAKCRRLRAKNAS